jgi:hypothetical protein
LCTQRDLLNGLDFHLYGSGQGRSNRWLSSVEIDLAPLVCERFKRNKRHIDKIMRLRNAAIERELEDKRKSEIKTNPTLPGPKGELVLSTEGSVTNVCTNAKRKEVVQLASKIVADHIVNMKKLIREYRGKIPDAKLNDLRKSSDQRLSKVFMGSYAFVGKQQRSEMIAKAEDKAYDPNESESRRNSTSSNLTSASTDKSQATNESVSTKNPKNNTVMSSRDKIKTTLTLKNNTEGHSFNHHLNKSMTAESAPESTASLQPNKNDHSLDPALNNLGSTGTPLDWSKQVVAEHKEYTRMVFRKYGYASLPSSELEPSRQKCLRDLLIIAEASGASYSPLQISEVIKEAENEVLRDEFDTQSSFSTALQKSGMSGRNIPQTLSNGIANRHQQSIQKQIQQQGHPQQSHHNYNVVSDLEMMMSGAPTTGNPYSRAGDAYSNNLTRDTTMHPGLSSSQYSNLMTDRSTRISELAPIPATNESWQQQIGGPLSLQQRQIPQSTSTQSVPPHYDQPSRLSSHHLQPQLSNLPPQYSDLLLQPGGDIMATLPWQAASTPNYEQIPQIGSIMSQQWQRPSSAPPPPIMYNTQGQQNGAQQWPPPALASVSQYSRSMQQSDNANCDVYPEWFNLPNNHNAR